MDYKRRNFCVKCANLEGRLECLFKMLTKLEKQTLLLSVNDTKYQADFLGAIIISGSLKCVSIDMPVRDRHRSQSSSLARAT